MAQAEGAAPVAFQAVAAGVVGAGIEHVVARGLVRQPALIAHRLDHPLAVLADHHRRVGAGKDAVVARQQLHPVQVFEPCLRALDAIAGHAQVVARLLGGARGKGGMGDVAALALAGQLGLQLLSLLRMPLLDLGEDVAALLGACGGKAIVHGFGGLRALLAGIVCVQFGKFLQRGDGAEFTHQLGVVGADQGGIAHGDSAGVGRSGCDADAAG